MFDQTFQINYDFTQTTSIDESILKALVDYHNETHKITGEDLSKNNMAKEKAFGLCHLRALHLEGKINVDNIEKVGVIPMLVYCLEVNWINDVLVGKLLEVARLRPELTGSDFKTVCRLLASCTLQRADFTKALDIVVTYNLEQFANKPVVINIKPGS